MYQPGIHVQVQRLRVASRVGQDGENGLTLFLRQLTGGSKAPLRARGQDDHAVVVGHQQLFWGFTPQAFGVIKVDLDHQYTDFLVAVCDGGGKKVAALARRCAQPEEAPQLALHRFAEIGAKGEVTTNEAVFFVPVGRGQRVAVGVHQVHDLSAGLSADVIE